MYKKTVLAIVGRLRMQSMARILDNETLGVLLDATPASLVDGWERGELGDYGSYLVTAAALCVLERTMEGRYFEQPTYYAGHTRSARCD